MEKPDYNSQTPFSLPRRRRDASKHDFGRLLIVAGSVGYTGAPSLASRAAVRGGAGLVYLGVPEAIYAVTAVKNDEAMPFPLKCGPDGLISPEALPELEERMAKCDVLAVGPGLGRSDGIVELVSGLLRASRVPTVLDADALWAVSRVPEALSEAGCSVVLTPHMGEFERLGGSVSAPREEAAVSFARSHGCAVVLKGQGTVCAFPDGDWSVNTTGNPGMARGGSGDVLTGLMGALLCYLPFRRAVRTAVYLHGLAGDLCAARLGEYGMTPMDMIGRIPDAMKSITEE